MDTAAGRASATPGAPVRPESQPGDGAETQNRRERRLALDLSLLALVGVLLIGAVAAAVALAGVGFEKTRVRLIADPAAPGNTHELEARGAFGDFRIVLNNKPLPENPKTSWLAALSVEQAVMRRFSFLEI